MFLIHRTDLRVDDIYDIAIQGNRHLIVNRSLKITRLKIGDGNCVFARWRRARRPIDILNWASLPFTTTVRIYIQNSPTCRLGGAKPKLLTAGVNDSQVEIRLPLPAQRHLHITSP